ncbi:hypothetical protein K1719_029043 [Acacia pycnantha]|nr:hypothetical protein K1719_029043 [Acacia pycnantha]
MLVNHPRSAGVSFQSPSSRMSSPNIGDYIGYGSTYNNGNNNNRNSSRGSSSNSNSQASSKELNVIGKSLGYAAQLLVLFKRTSPGICSLPPPCMYLYLELRIRVDL